MRNLTNIKSFLVISIVSSAVLLPNVQAAGVYSGGNGDPNDPYLIESADDIIEMSNDPNNWDKHFLMTADVNMVDYTFTTAVIAPDANSSSEDFQGIPFTGFFNGNNHTVSNLTIDTAGAGTGSLGLFGKIEGSSAEVKNLGIEDYDITSGDGHPELLGGLCGYNNGSISNCYATGSVAGGLYSENFGGLSGHNSGSINNCYAAGSVTGGDHSDYLGGLCGDNSGTITDCYATDSSVTGGDSWSVGGLCGGNTGTISNCYSTGSIICGDDSWFLGGLCGVNVAYGAINNCYSTGSVTGGANSRYLGGLCGSNGEIGPGLNSDGGFISNCYSTGSVNGDNDLGGLCGNQYGDIAEIINCFWDTETSGMTVGYNLDSSRPGTITNVVGKTTVEMKQKSTFTNWDFTKDWGIEDGQIYPFLRLTYPVGDLNLSKDVNLADLTIMAYHWLQSTAP